MDYIRQHQLDIMLILIGVLSGLAFYLFFTKVMSDKRRRILIMMAVCAILLLIADREAYIFRGDTSVLGYWMVRISNFLVFFMTLLNIYAFNLFLVNLFTEDGVKKEIPLGLKISKIILLLGMFLIILSQFNGLYYTFDNQNRYQRSDKFFIISYLIPLVALVVQQFTVIKNRKYISKRLRIVLLLFTILPLVASITQFKLYGLSLTNISLVWMVVVLYLFAIVDMNEKVERARKLEIEYLEKEKEQLKNFLKHTALSLASAIDAKDTYTNGHSLRVAEYSKMIAARIGYSESELDDIYMMGLLHDVGKIGVPDEVINKTSKLTDEEFELIKKHPVIGNEILKKITESPKLATGARWHHERYEGGGYPDGISGENIPEEARIIAVADAYDAMTSRRSYRDVMPQDKVRSEIEKGIGTQFDPRFAKCMLEIIDEDVNYELHE